MRRAWRPAIAASLVLMALPGCSGEPQWRGWLYPNREDLTRDIELGQFHTFEQCQEAAISGLRSLPDPDGGDYECGHKCRWDADLHLNVCAETRK